MQTMDDKAALVEKLLNWLNGELQQEKEWQSTSNEALVHAQVSLKNLRNSIFNKYKKTAVHRNLMSRREIYHCVLYPNNEIDIERDRVFSDHISRIRFFFLIFEIFFSNFPKSARLSPHHPALRIPSKYCRECPWPTAQEEGQLISIYRTPKEKMEQASRLCKVSLFKSTLHYVIAPRRFSICSNCRTPSMCPAQTISSQFSSLSLSKQIRPRFCRPFNLLTLLKRFGTIFIIFLISKN